MPERTYKLAPEDDAMQIAADERIRSEFERHGRDPRAMYGHFVTAKACAVNTPKPGREYHHEEGIARLRALDKLVPGGIAAILGPSPAYAPTQTEDIIAELREDGIIE